MNRWRVGILGAGMMAQGFDHPGADHVVSLAHAFARSPQFALEGFFDQDAGRTEAAERRWGCPASSRDRGDWLGAGWDVLCIATPDACHGDDLRDALQRRPKAILVEKPLSIDGAEALDLLHRARHLGVALMVNYPRRWHPAVVGLREAVAAGELSVPVSAFVAVSGGAIHNLPHTTDLIHTIWGGGWHVSLTGRKNEVVCLLCERAREAFTLTVLDRRAHHYVWEAHFYCADAKVELSHSPELLELSRPAPHPVYTSYQVLTPVFRAEMEQESLLCRVADELAEALSGPDQVSRVLERELESQRFTASVLQWF